MNNLSWDNVIKKDEVIDVILNTLKYIDNRLIYHGERVAYIAYELYKQKDFGEQVDLKTLILLSLFHDIGAFKTEEINHMIKFESRDVINHTVFGYLFLKYLSPLHDYAEVILHHHTPYKKLQTLNIPHAEYAEIIHLADRIDMFIQHNNETKLRSKLMNDKAQFNPDLVSCFLQGDVEQTIITNLQSGHYLTINRELRQQWDLTFDESFEYLRTLVYSVDFRSQQTVTHTINIVSITLSLAELLDIDQEDYQKLYLGALLHDIGKIAIPLSILESPYKLTTDEMAIMKKHVLYTEEIISGVVSQEICKIAIRHHEKLDGTGYPYGLTQSDLTLYEQLVAVADVFSALICKRSYKDAFPKEKIIDILTHLKESNHLNPQICELAITHYDDIITIAEMSSKPILAKYDQLYSEYSQLTSN